MISNIWVQFGGSDARYPQIKDLTSFSGASIEDLDESVFLLELLSENQVLQFVDGVVFVADSIIR